MEETKAIFANIFRDYCSQYHIKKKEKFYQNQVQRDEQLLLKEQDFQQIID